jgi:microcin C transport system substrate-binding protein
VKASLGRAVSFAVAALCLFASPSIAQTDASGQQHWVSSTALIGTPKYSADFKHFDYVNVNASKGGALRLSETGTFDSFNPILAKGTAADGLNLVFETLMTQSLDEPSTEYGLLAGQVSYPDDYSSVTYRLRPDARWQDGTPVTADDVVWSFNELVKLNPSQHFYYQHVKSVEKLGDRDVKFTFDEKGNRELPNIVGQLMVLPKHWWEGTDNKGRKRDIGETTLEPPMGSGPYRIVSFQPGASVTYARAGDYWGKDLPVNVGVNNFDSVSYSYFRDRDVEFQAFKADNFDYWEENVARRWATGYDFPAARQGDVKREMRPEPYRSQGVMVGFVPNLRRAMFQDRRVREVLNLAFDFETLNRTIFYGQYERIDSYFYGTPLRWEGLPAGKELDYLNGVRSEVPPEVFTRPYENPVDKNPEDLRNNLRKAVGLLHEAGYELRGTHMVDAKTGQPFQFQILLNGPTIEPVALALAQNLKKIGIDVAVRSVDTAQYINRLRARDYDMIYTGWGESLSPGNEQLDYWGSQAAATDASRNYAGISNPAVDALINDLLASRNRDDLVAATKALDRVLIWNEYVIPTYTLRKDRIAYWNRIAHPDPLPYYSVGFPAIWWYDAAAAARVKK